MKDSAIQKILDNAKLTKKNIKRRKHARISLPKEGVIDWCSQTIKLCQALLKRKTNKKMGRVSK